MTISSRSTPPADASKPALERITLQMTSSLNLEQVLKTITQGLVDELGASFARIWLLGPSDLCGACHKARDCSNRETCLHLKASSGIYTNLNGEYRRIPLGALKIGQIAQGWGAMSTNDVMNDARLPNPTWLAENGFRSFAGHPLIFNGDLLGVVALFSQQFICDEEFDRLAVFANQAAIAIKNAQLFEQVEHLKNQLKAENTYLKEEIKLAHNFDNIIGKSEAVNTVVQQIHQVAETETTVLITGETGTGKELIAHAIHNLGPRKNRAMVKVNCAALPANLIESELFGHEKGAFTGALGKKIGRFALADGGTLFLDEIGELPSELQAKLLRVLQEGEFEFVGGVKTVKVDVRVIAATNKSLTDEVKAGRFRSDLFYRLNVFPILSPPLRDRPEDISLLAHSFLKKFAQKLKRGPLTISDDEMNALQQYSWPGNIRELQNVIERAAITASGPSINVSTFLEAPDLPQDFEHTHSNSQHIQDVDRAHILRVLDKVHWVIDGKGGAARILGLHPNTLRFRMRKLGIQRPPKDS